jgi:protein-S-isoprenylcysteine O-methyltransferase Ste14
MKATAFEFRIRFLLHALVYGLGFFAPWNLLLHLDAPGPNAHVWGILAAALAKAGVASIATAFNGLLVLGIVFAVAGAALRTWGAAYLGSGVVQDGAMQTSGYAGSVIADGPYRHLRNPLYVGTMLHSFALALLMPVSGAVFTLAVVALMQVRLILGEESFLLARLGSGYAAYCRLVPRVLPVLRARVAASGKQAAWGQAFLGEIYMWGVAGSFATVGWHYNASLLTQCAIVSLGVSLVVRALADKPKPAAEVAS